MLYLYNKGYKINIRSGHYFKTHIAYISHSCVERSFTYWISECLYYRSDKSVWNIWYLFIFYFLNKFPSNNNFYMLEEILFVDPDFLKKLDSYWTVLSQVYFKTSYFLDNGNRWDRILFIMLFFLLFYTIYAMLEIHISKITTYLFTFHIYSLWVQWIF